MSTRKRLASGGASLLSGTVASLIAASDHILRNDSAIKAVLSAEPMVRYGAIVAILLAAAFFLREALQKVSVLIRPEEIVPRKERQHQLIGRDEQVTNLVELCKSNRLIFLRGASGVGKSALVYSGLIPRLKNGPDFLPIYFATWGIDWESGPIDELARVVLVSLRDTPLKLAKAPTSDELVPLFAAIRNVLGQNPVLIFDQFDEYQSRHYGELVQSGVWIRPEQLSEKNLFWNIVRSVVTSGAATCMFVVRSDSELGVLKFPGLDNVTRTLDVLPLDRGWIEIALQRLTDVQVEGKPVIENPESGWTRLRSRLADDLARSDTAHPIQLSLALKALHRLPVLTSSAYDAVGRLDGLIAGFITDKARVAASTGGVSEEETLQALARLVDEDRSRTRELLESELTEGKRGIRSALQSLEQDGLVKSRGEAAERRWMLFHDFFAPAVTEAVRRRDEIADELRRRRREFETAVGLVEGWRALLPAALQLRIWWNQPARTSYFQTPRFAVLSTLRFLPPVAVAGLVLGSVAWIRRDVRANALLTDCAEDTTECAEAIRQASAKERFHAFKMDWPGHSHLARISLLRPPWPAELPDESGFVTQNLIPCAKGEQRQYFHWRLLGALPLLTIYRREDDPSRCATSALTLSARRRETATALLPTLPRLNINASIQVLSQVLEADIDYRVLAEGLRSDETRFRASPVEAELRREASLEGRHYLARRRAGRPLIPPSLAPPAGSHTQWAPSNAELDSGRERFVKLVETANDPWYAAVTWNAIRDQARRSEVERLKRVLERANLQAYRGNYGLLVSYLEILGPGSASPTLADQLVTMVDERLPSPVLRWQWVEALCALGVPAERIPLEFNTEQNVREILDASHLAQAGAPLASYTRASLCKYPQSTMDSQHGLASRLLTAFPSNPGVLIPGVAADLNLAVAALWPFTNSQGRASLMQLALEMLHNAVNDFDTNFALVVSAFLSTASEKETTELCETLTAALADARGGTEILSLALSTESVCTRLPATEILDSLNQARGLNGYQLASLLKLLPEHQRCANSCLAFEVGNRQTLPGDDLAGWAASGASCLTVEPCPSAALFARRLPLLTYSPAGRLASDLPAEVARNLLTLSARIPESERRELVHRLVSDPGSMDYLPGGTVSPGGTATALVLAWCRNPVGEIAQALRGNGPHPNPLARHSRAQSCGRLFRGLTHVAVASVVFTPMPSRPIEVDLARNNWSRLARHFWSRTRLVS